MRTTLLAASIAIAACSLIASCESSTVSPPAPPPLTTEAPQPVSSRVVTSEPVLPPPPPPTPTQAPAPPPVVVPKPVEPPAAPAPAPDPPDDDVHYENCAEARAAGVAPLNVGEPGYREGLDRDNDGVACE